MFSFTPSSVKKSNEQLVQKHERMTQMKLKRLRSIDKEREQVGCSSDILPDRELESEATAPESCLEQTGDHYENESLDGSGTHENVTSNEDIKIEDHITNEELVTDEDQMPREEDSQSVIHQLRRELEECKQKLQSQLQEAKLLQARPTIIKTSSKKMKTW